MDNKIIQNQSVSVNKKINKNEMIFKKEKHFKYAWKYYKKKYFVILSNKNDELKKIVNFFRQG